MSIRQNFKTEEYAGAIISYSIWAWPYTHKIEYKDTSLIMRARTRVEARFYALAEEDRREQLVIDKLKE